MRLTQLAQVALQAEKIRLQARARGLAFRVGFSAAAAVFVVFALALGHVAAYGALCDRLPPPAAAGVVAGADVLLALLMLVVGAGFSRPGKVSADARQVRNDALAQLRNTVAIGAALRPAGRIGLRLAGRKPLLAAALAAAATGVGLARRR